MYLNVKKFYKRENMKVLFFSWMNCLRFNLPTISLENAAKNFMKHHGLTDDEFNLESSLVEYQRMVKEYFETEKSETAR